jgi:E3 ubiquitin-protein ligase CHFR
MEKSDECPICRKIVQRISKNHLVNSLIESYLKENPQCKRSQDDLDRLNEKNKINGEMVIGKQKM